MQNHQHINSATTHNIFNIIFLVGFTLSKSNLCGACVHSFFDGNNSDKVTSRRETSTKSPSTLYECLLLNIWTADWDKRACFIYMHSFWRKKWNIRFYVSLSSVLRGVTKMGIKILFVSLFQQNVAVGAKALCYSIKNLCVSYSKRKLLTSGEEKNWNILSPVTSDCGFIKWIEYFHEKIGNSSTFYLPLWARGSGLMMEKK